MPIDIIQNIEKGVLPNTATTQLFLMDVEKFLDALPMQPIFDLVVTSPPYNIGKEYENQVPLSDYYDWQKRIIEKIYAGIDIGILAAKQNKKPEEIRTYIECYNYAAQYLESIGHPDEWTRVDKQEYAFKQIVIGRKNIVNPGDKELFQEISKAMLQTPAVGDRLYKQIPKVVSSLSEIAPKLQEVFDITIQDNNDDDLNLLTGGDVSDSNTANAQIAAAIRQAENPTLVAQTVKSVLDTTEELEKEKKKKSFIFDQVMKAATALTNAVSNLDDSMSKEGIGKQIENIEGALVSLKDWIK